MGPGPDGPMGGMGAMEQHHMNGSLGEAHQIPPESIPDDAWFFLCSDSFKM